MIEVLTLFPDCSPVTCELLPVWSGRNFNQYQIKDAPPVGYVENHLLEAFLLYKTVNSREREESVYMYTDVDAAADAWLWSPPGYSDKPYSSRPRFTVWWRQQLLEWHTHKSHPMLPLLQPKLFE